MLRPALNSFGFIDPTGLVQAWGGVFAAYKGDTYKLSQVLDPAGEEKFLLQESKGFGAYDGGIFVVQSLDDFYIYIGPGSGKEDYLAWAAIGVHATAFLKANAWVNTLWSSYLQDIYNPIMAKVRPLLKNISKINIIGFSLGGAMGEIFARAISAEGIMNQVQSVGFGTPRGIGNNAPATPLIHNVRVATQNDPVDLVPPPDVITLDGGTIPPLLVPTAWANVGLRFVLPGDGAIVLQADPPWPGLIEFSLTFPVNIFNHDPGRYSSNIKGFYSAQAALGNQTEAGGNFVNLIDSLLTGTPLIPPPPVIVFAPLPPGVADKILPIVPQQSQVPPTNFITPFVQGPPAVPNGATLPPGIGVDPH